MLAKWVNGEAMIRTDSHLPSLYLLMAWHQSKSIVINSSGCSKVRIDEELEPLPTINKAYL